MLKAQVGAAMNGQSRILLKTIGAFTRPIVTKRLDGPKRCIQTQVVGIPIIRVAHEPVDRKMLAVPHTCHTRRRRAVGHGHMSLSPAVTSLPSWTSTSFKFPGDGRGANLMR